ncbi:MAG: ATP-binding protein [Cyanobacteria bacterium REEB67]|nr:ATP-binding protein [Cyanobacteria bacterium REEB67]
MADFEKLGVFYLGKKYDMQARQVLDDLVLYDSSDLTTHAVCIGMTGSGKTGLCLGLLEEAAIDGIPVIAIDPKGDLGNLLLTFPDLAAADFAPWVDSTEARRRGVSVDELAASEADHWREGLKTWQQDGGRIKRLRDAADLSIYTPGSSAGIAVSILHSLSRPDQALLEDGDLLREKIASAAGCILALLGIAFDPLKSRDHILLASIIGDAWKNGRDIALPDLIGLIQKPPLTRVCALDLESFYPAKERLELSLAINNLLAAPGFESWLTGVPLDIDSILYCSAGKPRISIFSISHLSDQERMFFVTLLLNEIISWMRAQSGTPSLRAILYMDEIFGYFPPVANPPAKQPLLTLLKQARAFGLGVVLASQNPVDIDYKGLSNAGTWFIGRLQTDRDKQRLLDGLESASQENSSHSAGHGQSFDRQGMSEILSSLDQRVFLMNNVHEDKPVLFETRWTLSYLRGPLARQEIKRLMEPAKKKAAEKPADIETNLCSDSGEPVGPSANTDKRSNLLVDPAIEQLFVPVSVAAFSGSAKNNYEATLLASATVRFSEPKYGVELVQERNYLVPVSRRGVLPIDFKNAKAIKVALADLPTKAPTEVDLLLSEPDQALLNASKYKDYGRDFLAYLSASCKLILWRSPSTGLVSRPGESERDFRIRLSQAASEKRDELVAGLRGKYQARIQALQEKIRLAEFKINEEEAQAKQAEVDSAIAIGATVLGAFMGRKPLGSTSVGRASTAARGVNRAAKQRQDVELARSNRVELEQKLGELETQFRNEAAAIGTRLDSQREAFEEVALLPKKTAIKVNLIGLAWVKG